MKSLMLARTLLPLLLASALTASVTAQEAPLSVADTLKTQAIAWDDAIVHKRRQAIEANMAPEFLHIGEDGALSNHAAFLDALLSEHLSIEPYAMDALQVRVFGDAALLTGTTRMRGTWRGKPFASHYRFTDTYIRRNGAWKVVQVQITALPQE